MPADEPVAAVPAQQRVLQREQGGDAVTHDVGRRVDERLGAVRCDGDRKALLERIEIAGGHAGLHHLDLVLRQRHQCRRIDVLDLDLHLLAVARGVREMKIFMAEGWMPKGPWTAQDLAANADKVAEYKGGKEALFGFFVGQTMKAMQGKGNPQLVNEAIRKALG